MLGEVITSSRPWQVTAPRAKASCVVSRAPSCSPHHRVRWEPLTSIPRPAHPSKGLCTGDDPLMLSQSLKYITVGPLQHPGATNALHSCGVRRSFLLAKHRNDSHALGCLLEPSQARRVSQSPYFFLDLGCLHLEHHPLAAG